MKTSQVEEKPWWQTTATVLSSILAFIGLVVGVVPLLSDTARQVYKDHWYLGWIAAVVFFLVSCVLFVLLKQKEELLKQQAASLELLERQVDLLEQQANSAGLLKQEATRKRECESDVAVATLWIGPFMRDGEARTKLEQIPHHKLFSRNLSYAMEKLSRDLNDRSKEVFDHTLRLSIAEMKDSFESYWCTFENYLDGPGEMMKERWDLTIIQPPGGNWPGTTRRQQDESFYQFVRSLASLKDEFLDKVDAVEKITHRLRIEADLPTRI